MVVFLTHPKCIGILMVNIFLRASKDLWYLSSYSSLVFQSNIASVQLWESLGFARVTTLENAARLSNGMQGL